jgi:rubrerythrin
MKKTITWRLLLIVALTFLAIGPYLLTQVSPALAAQEAPRTLENLQKGYDIEKNTFDAYEAFAEKADKEGYGQAASLFRAAAASQAIHLGKYRKAMKELNAVPKENPKAPTVKSTKENLNAAIKMEKNMMAAFPEYAKQAGMDKKKIAMMAFKGTEAGAQFHINFFSDAMSNLDAWKKGTKQFIVCKQCGYMTTDLTLKKCPICSYPRSQFLDVK